jgi:hypothetical protein
MSGPTVDRGVGEREVGGIVQRSLPSRLSLLVKVERALTNSVNSISSSLLVSNMAMILLSSGLPASSGIDRNSSVGAQSLRRNHNRTAEAQISLEMEAKCSEREVKPTCGDAPRAVLVELLETTVKLVQLSLRDYIVKSKRL